MVRGSFIMIEIKLLETHIIKCCLGGLRNRQESWVFRSITAYNFLKTAETGGKLQPPDDQEES